jgi:hypothetical protein
LKNWKEFEKEILILGLVRMGWFDLNNWKEFEKEILILGLVRMGWFDLKHFEVGKD